MSDVGASRHKTAVQRYVRICVPGGNGWSNADKPKAIVPIRLRLRRLAAYLFSPAPRYAGIGHTESVIIHGFFALFAGHVPTSIDATLNAPGI
jgi:hypothetical protein